MHGQTYAYIEKHRFYNLHLVFKLFGNTYIPTLLFVYTLVHFIDRNIDKQRNRKLDKYI